MAALVGWRYVAAVSGEVAEVDSVHYRLMDTIGGLVSVARRTRRFWSEDEKRRIVAQSYAPGVSVSVVARRYDVNANLIFMWRRDPPTSRRPAPMPPLPSCRWKSCPSRRRRRSRLP